MANNNFVTWRTVSAVAGVIVVLGGIILGFTWDDHKEFKSKIWPKVSILETNFAVQQIQLSTIESDVKELKNGQKEILRRLPHP